MPRATLRILLATLLILGSPAILLAQGTTQGPEPVDSLTAWIGLGLYSWPDEQGDSTLVDVYVSLLSPDDTAWARRWALRGGSWLLAQARNQGFRRTGVIFLWPSRTDELSAKRRQLWSMYFAIDDRGCWHVENDTTPVSSCAAH
jgi:hypothetical protein